MQKDLITVQSAGCEQTSEKDAIVQAQQGEPEAFRFLYLRYKNYVAGQCRRLGCDLGLTEDLTQDVFFQLWKKIAGFKGQSALRTWIHRITVNVVFGHFRRHRHNWQQLEFTSSAGRNIDLAEMLAGAPCGLDDHVLISQLLSSLSTKDRRVVLLHAAGFKHCEIARILRIPGSSSRSRLSRIREKLKKNQLHNSPVDRHSPSLAN